MKRTNTRFLKPEEPCPCWSGKALRDCCLLQGVHLRTAVPAVIPPPPATGHQQAGCYLFTTSDCSTDLSNEHYLSKSVLESLGNKVMVAGAPWLPAGEQREISIKGLTAKILCRRHNSALSPLDAMAGAFFAHLCGPVLGEPGRKSLSRKGSLRLFSGEALELWMLKTACGLFHSRMAARAGVGLADDHVINQELVEAALLRHSWQPDCGLYFRAIRGHRFVVSSSVAMAPLSVLSENRVVGVGLTLAGLEFHLVFDPIGVNPTQLTKEGWLRRPTELHFQFRRGSHSIGLTWPPGSPVRSVRIVQGPNLQTAG